MTDTADRARRGLVLLGIGCGLLGLMCGTSVWAQVADWSRRIDVAGSLIDYAGPLRVDAEGSSYAASASFAGLRLTKRDANGNLIWSTNRLLDEFQASSEALVAVELDQTGSAYVGVQDIDPDRLSADFGLAKYGPDGSLLWSNTYDLSSRSRDRLEQVLRTDAGRFYLAGRVGIDGQPDRIGIVAVAADGSALWRVLVEGAYRGAFLAADGGVYVLANDPQIPMSRVLRVRDDGVIHWAHDVSDTWSLSAGAAVSDGGAIVGSYSSLRRIDALGNELWRINALAERVLVPDDEVIFACGKSSDGQTLSVSMFTLEGQKRWERMAAPPAPNLTSQLIDFLPTADGGCISNWWVRSGPNVYATIVGYRPDGAARWNTNIPVSFSGIAPHLATDPANGIRLADSNQSPTGSFDAVVARYDGPSTPVWSESLDTSTPVAWPLDVVSQSDGGWLTLHTTGAIRGLPEIVVSRYMPNGLPHWEFHTHPSPQIPLLNAELVAPLSGKVATNAAGVVGFAVGAPDLATAGAMLVGTVPVLGPGWWSRVPTVPAPFDWVHYAALAVQADGELLVAGEYQNYSEVTGFVTKYGAGGAIAWERQFDDVAVSAATSLAQDASGAIYVAGFVGDGDLSGDRYAAAWKLSAAGEIIWSARLSAGTEARDAGIGIFVDSAGRVRVAVKINRAGIRTWAAMGLDADTGAVVWSSAPPPGISVQLQAAILVDDELVLAGNLWQPNTYWDMVVARYGTNGTLRWSSALAARGGGGETCSSLAADAAGNVYAAGQLDFRSDYRTGDAFVAKFDAQGRRRWVQRYAGAAAGADRAVVVAAQSNGDVLAAIATVGAGPTATDPGRSVLYQHYADSAMSLPSDANCDGSVNNFDIDAFVLAVVDFNAWRAAYPTCPASNIDSDIDGRSDLFDIDAFVSAIVGAP